MKVIYGTVLSSTVAKKSDNSNSYPYGRKHYGLIHFCFRPKPPSIREVMALIHTVLSTSSIIHLLLAITLKSLDLHLKDTCTFEYFEPWWWVPALASVAHIFIPSLSQASNLKLSFREEAQQTRGERPLSNIIIGADVFVVIVCGATVVLP